LCQGLQRLCLSGRDLLSRTQLVRGRRCLWPRAGSVQCAFLSIPFTLGSSSRRPALTPPGCQCGPHPPPRSGLLGLPSPSYKYCTPRFLTGNVCLSSPDAAVVPGAPMPRICVVTTPPRSHQPVRGQQWPWPGQGQRSRRCPAPPPGSRWQVWGLHAIKLNSNKIETPLACCAGRSAYNVLTPGP
jgi:hypothetical protein